MKCKCEKCVHCIRMDKNGSKMRCRKYQCSFEEPKFCIKFTTKKDLKKLNKNK